LSDSGHDQIEKLAKKLFLLTKRKRIRILTSPVDCARDSADILGSILGVIAKPCDILRSGEGHPILLQEAYDLIQSQGKNVDILIIVTHLGYVYELPVYFAEKTLYIQVVASSVGEGCAVIIDIRAKKLSLMSVAAGQ
jgi:phosphohistidine phosphatase SixA